MPPFPNGIIIAESRPRFGAAFRSADRSLRRSLLRPRLRPRSWRGWASPWGHVEKIGGGRHETLSPWLFLGNLGHWFFWVYSIPIYGKKWIYDIYTTCCLNWRVSVSILSDLIVTHFWSISQKHDCEVNLSPVALLQRSGARKMWKIFRR